MKQCSECKEWKSLSCFGVDKTGSDGLRSQCKVCRNKIERDRTNGIRHIQTKSGCPKNLPKWLLQLRKTVKYLIRSERRRNSEELTAKHRESAKRYLREHKEKERERSRVRDYQRREEIKTNGGAITAAEWRALKRKYDYTCLRCKRREPDIKLTLDHVNPLAKPFNGPNVIGNAQPLCVSCNSSKGKRWIDYR